MRVTALTGVVVGVLSATGAIGQSFNIDYGQPGAGPPADYAAAGRPGVWNSVEAEHTPSIGNPQLVYPLVDLAGNATGVELHQFGGMDLRSFNDGSVTGSDSILLNDALLTHSSGLESCIYFRGLENGTYELITYAWMPDSPGTNGLVSLDFHPDEFLVGGAWTGGHVNGITYSVHMIEVTDGKIGSHVGIPVGGDTVVGAAVNGMQLRLIEDCVAPSLVDATVGTPVAQNAFDGYIDPRIESSDGTNVDLGLTAVTLKFNTAMRNAVGADLTTAAFTITSDGGPAPGIASIETEDNTTVTVHLDEPMSPQQWTTISTSAVSDCAGAAVVGRSSVRIGYLPGDIDQSGFVNPVDLFRFRQIVNGALTMPNGVDADYVDTDRNGNITPIDLFRYRQLINGVSPATQSWAGATLP